MEAVNKNSPAGTLTSTARIPHHLARQHESRGGRNPIESARPRYALICGALKCLTITPGAGSARWHLRQLHGRGAPSPLQKPAPGQAHHAAMRRPSPGGANCAAREDESHHPDKPSPDIERVVESMAESSESTAAYGLARNNRSAALRHRSESVACHQHRYVVAHKSVCEPVESGHIHGTSRKTLPGISLSPP